MYESFYGFREKPFSLLPDPGFLFLTPKHRMALTMLEYGLASQAGFTVITGEIGAGKTTLIRKLLENTDPNITVGLVTNTQCKDFEDLLRWIVFAFGLDYGGKYHVGMYHAFTDLLIREYGEGKRVVVIIDEAQQLGLELLEQVRMLSNINADKHQVVQFILVGQPSLRELLRRPELDQFAQRIAVDYHLKALDPDETKDYIQHRLNVAGGDPDLFSEDGCRLIWRYSRGIPRIINVLCDTALVYGFSGQEHRISIKLVEEVLRDKQASLTPVQEAQSDTQSEIHNIKAKRSTIEKLFSD